MKFNCEKCGAIYSIADAKVRNKTLKVRCRRCAAIIELRDPHPETHGQPQGDDTTTESVATGEADLVCWFMGIDGMAVGPVSARRIHSYRRIGRINGDSPIWREATPDWLALRECSALTALLDALDLKEGEQPQQERELYPPPIPIERQTHERQADPAASFTSVEAIDHQSAFPTPEEVRIGSIRRLSPPRPISEKRLVMLASIGFFFITVVFFLAVVFVGEKEYVTRYVERVVYRDRVASVPSPAQKSSVSDAQRNDNIPVDGRDGTLASKAEAPRNLSGVNTDKRKLDEKTKRLMEQLGGSGPSSGDLNTGRSREAGDRITTSRKLAESELNGVVARKKNELKVCYERALKRGEAPMDRDVRADFDFIVGSSGAVRNLKVTGSVVDYPALRICLVRSVNAWVFPPAADHSKVEFPLVFTPRP